MVAASKPGADEKETLKVAIPPLEEPPGGGSSIQLGSMLEIAGGA